MTIIEKLDNHSLKIIINRLERGNSLDPLTLVQLRKSLLQAQSNSEVKVIILTGLGNKDFTTGIDLKEARSLSKENILNLSNIAGDIATLLFYGKPSIVAMNGRTMGMGIVFAIASDYRLIVQDAIMQMPEINASIFPGATCTAIMTRVCGLTTTRKLLYFGNVFTPEYALKENIADEIVSSVEELEERTKFIASELLSKDLMTLKKIKSAINNALDLNFKTAIALESTLLNINLDKDFDKTITDFKLEYELHGNPAKLLEEYNELNGSND